MARKTKAEIQAELKAVKAELKELKGDNKEITSDCKSLLECALKAVPADDYVVERRVKTLIKKAIKKL